jgi:hypothetical protein
MAHAVTPVLGSFYNQEESVRLKTFIIWLDKYIGQPDEYIMLKSSFFLAMNATTGVYDRSLTKDDIHNSIRAEAHLIVQLDQVKFMFQAFDNVEKCFETIGNNLDKHTFFITSGSKGKIIIPSLIINFPETFVPEYWMYVFCGNMNMIQVADVVPANTWALNFSDRIAMFDHQDDLLSRLVFDMARYFSEKAGDLENNNQRLEDARQHFNWSKKMYQRYGMMTQRNMTREVTQIDQSVSLIKERINQQLPDNEDGYGEACDE